MERRRLGCLLIRPETSMASEARTLHNYFNPTYNPYTITINGNQLKLQNTKNRRESREMFFFFVGGLEQQARQVLKSGVGRCIACGSPADLVEYDKVLKLFFVPVWRWPGKEPVMNCKDCNIFFPQSISPPPPQPRLPEKEVVDAALKCQFCSRQVDASFRFCPFCGSAM